MQNQPNLKGLRWLVVWLVGRSVGHNFLRGWQVSLPCSYRRTCLCPGIPNCFLVPQIVPETSLSEHFYKLPTLLGRIVSLTIVWFLGHLPQHDRVQLVLPVGSPLPHLHGCTLLPSQVIYVSIYMSFYLKIYLIYLPVGFTGRLPSQVT